MAVTVDPNSEKLSCQKKKKIKMSTETPQITPAALNTTLWQKYKASECTVLEGHPNMTKI